MTPGRPAGASRQKTGMIHFANVNRAVCTLLLEVALKAEGLVPLGQHLRVDRSVRDMAGGAAFAQRLMLENKRSPLLGVALETGLVPAHHVGRAPPLDDRSLVWVVAVRAAHLAFRHRVMIWQVELSASFQVALKTGFRIFAGIDDRICRAAGLHVEAARSVTAFASGSVCRILALRHQARMIGSPEVADDFRVAVGAGIVTHKARARNGGGRHDRLRGAARNHHRGQHDAARENPQKPNPPASQLLTEREAPRGG